MNHVWHSTDIVAYMYNADLYHPRCILKVVPFNVDESVNVEDNLTLMAQVVEVNRNDENTFDSDEFPKVILLANIEGDPVDEDGNDRNTCGLCLEPILEG